MLILNRQYRLKQSLLWKFGNYAKIRDSELDRIFEMGEVAYRKDNEVQRDWK